MERKWKVFKENEKFKSFEGDVNGNVVGVVSLKRNLDGRV